MSARPAKIRAAQYVRMSTEHQQFSTDNQVVAIAKFADDNGYEIVRTYADEGKSGLNLGGRAGLQQVLDDVATGRADYQALLVYDVSRLGRFQDTDEAATYELRLRSAGIKVEYASEQFRNDGSIGSSIIKTVKRAMAGEYSRELSVKVFAGQSNLIRLGFRQGGAAGFGLRRLLVDQSGSPKSELGRGEQKSIATDRIILVPGPPDEVEIVREVYRLIEKGEQRLLRSVESRTIPISVAVEIAEADDHNVQRALQTAYEKGLLRGRKLLAAKRLVEARRRRGKSLASREARPSEKLSATALVRAYQEDAERKRDMIRRANMAKDRLMLITEALRRLSKDAPLMAIIQAEKLDTMPEKIAARLGGRASA